MLNDTDIIQQVRCWVTSVIVALNFCPFARREVERDSIGYVVEAESGMQQHLENLIEACQTLDAEAAIETTLIIYPDAYQDFDDFLDLIAIAQDLLVEQGYDGIYQLAHFHPDYCFDGVEENDASNYTNRSPYPILHIIREASIEQALAHYPDAEKIPQKNIELARKLGNKQLQDKLNHCKQLKNDK